MFKFCDEGNFAFWDVCCVRGYIEVLLAGKFCFLERLLCKGVYLSFVTRETLLFGKSFGGIFKFCDQGNFAFWKVFWGYI